MDATLLKRAASPANVADKDAGVFIVCKYIIRFHTTHPPNYAAPHAMAHIIYSTRVAGKAR